jgi:hypothetical protein
MPRLLLDFVPLEPARNGVLFREGIGVIGLDFLNIFFGRLHVLLFADYIKHALLLAFWIWLGIAIQSVLLHCSCVDEE